MRLNIVDAIYDDWMRFVMNTMQYSIDIFDSLFYLVQLELFKSLFAQAIKFDRGHAFNCYVYHVVSGEDAVIKYWSTGQTLKHKFIAIEIGWDWDPALSNHVHLVSHLIFFI